MDKLDTMGVNSRTEVIPIIYKKDDKKDTASYRSISFLNLDYIIYTSFLKIACKKSVIIGEKRNFIIRLYARGSTASRL